MIDAARVTAILSPIGDTLPANEAQARELVPLLDDPDLLRQTWQRAVESSGGKPTAVAVAAARDGRPAEDDDDTWQRHYAQAGRPSLPGLPALDEEGRRIYADTLTVRDAARTYLRTGDCPLPPRNWTHEQIRSRGGRTPISAAKNRLASERMRLFVWSIIVELEVGRFLIWCDKAGIKIGEQVTFPERLRYRLEDGDPPLPAEWTAEDEHHAALGHFYGWWCTRDELAAMSAT
jgi:hypothetical protein